MYRAEWMIVGMIALVVVGTAYFSIRALVRTEAPIIEPVGAVCTADAKKCPDGTYVGRVGPTCEFALCEIASTTEEISTSTDNQESTAASSSRGIRGTVLLGPMCPVVHNPAEPGCEDQPYETTVSAVRKWSNAAVYHAKTDVNGRFELAVPPSEYQVSATGGNVLPRCEPVSVTVVVNKFESVKISCDTGIR